MEEDDGERNVNVDVDGAEVWDGHDDDDYDGNHGADHDDYDDYDADDGALGCPQGSSIEVGRVNCRRHDLYSLWAQTPATHERKERKKRKKEQERNEEGGGGRKPTGKGT